MFPAFTNSTTLSKKYYICENHKTMHQEALLKEIRRKIGERSLNDEIANILNISYDAAHRRTSLKAKFSFEEALELASTIRFHWISFWERKISWWSKERNL
jgi:hypothetical protein